MAAASASWPGTELRELQEIERAIDRRIVTLAPAKKLEVREAVRVARDQFAVDDAGSATQAP
jgi:hypothetical protein